jgi:hypothetical protein
MLTTIHTLICFIAIGFGVVSIAGLVRHAAPEPWTALFLLCAVLATGTGFLFPYFGPTPAFVTGIVSTVVLIVTLAARYLFALAGWWRKADALGLVISLYLLVFVTIAQAFQKIPTLNVLAPTGSEAPFVIAQVVCLAVFVVIGFRAVRSSRTSTLA